MLPSPPEEINTKFFFYSTKNRSDRPLMELPFLNMTEAFRNSKTYKNYNKKRSLNESDLLDVTTEAPQTTTLPPTRKTASFRKTPITLDDLQGFDEMSVRVIVHGFGSACPHVWIYEMKTALMAVVGLNLKTFLLYEYLKPKKKNILFGNIFFRKIA